MRGRQYHGRFYPGPTALILETPGAPVGKQLQQKHEAEHPQLKVLGITDEFVRCEEQQGSILERLAATYEKGGEDDENADTTTAPTKKTPIAHVKSTSASSRKKAKSS